MVKAGTNKSLSPTKAPAATSTRNPTTQSSPTPTTSTVSSLTTDNIERMIEKNNAKTSTSFKKLLQDELTKQKAETDSAIQKISERMEQLEITIETLQQSMAQTVANEITRKFTQLEEKINNNYATLETTFKQTFANFIDTVKGTGSPNRKKTKINTDDTENEDMQE